MCIVQWHYVHSLCCATVTTSISTTFHFLQRKLSPLNTPTPRPPFLGCTTLLSVSELDYSRHFREVGSHGICPVLIGLFHLAPCLQGSPMFVVRFFPACFLSIQLFVFCFLAEHSDFEHRVTTWKFAWPQGSRLTTLKQTCLCHLHTSVFSPASSIT